MAASMKKILFIGDSLIEFFDWESRFPGHTIANLGRAGETVEGLLSRIQGIIMKYPAPDLAFIMTGINNVAMEDFGFLDSYRAVIQALAAAYAKARIFIHSLLPTTLEWLTDDSIREVNLSLLKIASEKGVDFIDLYQRFVDRDGTPREDYLLSDGVHLSDKGYAVWAEELERIITQRGVKT
jgi:lysophospholipase L1-like esterase